MTLRGCSLFVCAPLLLRLSRTSSLTTVSRQTKHHLCRYVVADVLTPMLLRLDLDERTRVAEILAALCSPEELSGCVRALLEHLSQRCQEVSPWDGGYRYAEVGENAVQNSTRRPSVLTCRTTACVAVVCIRCIVCVAPVATWLCSLALRARRVLVCRLLLLRSSRSAC
jgi:hypothetical protein